MELALTKRFLLACQEAKTIVERQPRLPRGMKPGHVRVLDTIHQLSREQGQVRAGDVGRTMGITRPSITRLTHELVEMGCVEQKQLEEDRRVILVELTAKGEKNLRLLCPPIPPVAQWTASTGFPFRSGSRHPGDPSGSGCYGTGPRAV